MGGDLAEVPSNPPVTVTAMTVPMVAKLLSLGGGKAVTPDDIELDIASGAPANGDGTVNLMHYAAWLIQELASRGPQSPKA